VNPFLPNIHGIFSRFILKIVAREKDSIFGWKI
jgi:hypothetical protein